MAMFFKGFPSHGWFITLFYPMISDKIRVGDLAMGIPGSNTWGDISYIPTRWAPPVMFVGGL